jgi:hypothetical protein
MFAPCDRKLAAAETFYRRRTDAGGSCAFAEGDCGGELAIVESGRCRICHFPITTSRKREQFSKRITPSLDRFAVFLFSLRTNRIDGLPFSIQ